MEELIDAGLAEYVFEHSGEEPALLRELEEQTRREMEYPQMLTGRIEGRLLKLLVQLVQPRLIVEVGMFTGYSALSMAEGLSADGHIITCEISTKAQEIAQAAFDRSPHGKKIEIRMGEALNTLKEIDQEIDFSFIDADKENYPAYYEIILEKTRPGGVLLFDNMLWSGKVLDPQDLDTIALDKLNKMLVKDNRVENVLLSVRDGVQLVRKV